LSPAYLRLGGTAADLVTFRENGPILKESIIESSDSNSTKCYSTENVCENLDELLYKNRTNITMSGQDWIEINEFTKRVGWSFLFDVNVLKRNPRGNWR
jgi:hypothetical protein